MEPLSFWIDLTITFLIVCLLACIPVAVAVTVLAIVALDAI